MSYNFTKILSGDTIGDSLTPINQNYSNLDQWTTSIQTSATQYWIPVMNFYNQIQNQLKQSVDISNKYKTNWGGLSSTVTSNSAIWVQPIISFYPMLLTLPTIDAGLKKEDIAFLDSWMNSYRKVQDELGNINYVENQTGYLYVMTQYSQFNYGLNTYVDGHIVNQPVLQPNVTPLQSNGYCLTYDQNVCGTCTTAFKGIAYCSNGNFICDGNFATCTECNTVNCSYPQTNTHAYIPAIEAWLNITYNNIAPTNNLICIKYKVQNCSWVNVKLIGSI